MNNDLNQLSEIWSDAKAPPDFAARVLSRVHEPETRPARGWVRIAVATAIGAAAAAFLLLAFASDSRTSRLTKDETTRAAPVARVEQTDGFTHYQLEAHHSIVVDTPHGEIAATGAHFSVEVDSMKRELLSAAGGAAIAATVVVIYQGTVAADAGDQATVTAEAGESVVLSDGRVSAAGPTTTVAPASATRRELVIRDRVHVKKIAGLRTRVAELEAKLEALADPSAAAKNGEPPEKKFLELSEEELAVLADRCEIRYDIPAYAMSSDLAPHFDRIFEGVDVTEVERAALQQLLSKGDPELVALLRAIYIEVTGDKAGADSLSPRNMQHEVFEKSLPADVRRAFAAISSERAGRSEPPADLSGLPPVERLLRALADSGAQLENAIASELGAERARALRKLGAVWARRSQSGCPKSQ